MIVLDPVTITDVMLTSNVPETEYPAYNTGTAYSIGNRVISAHKVYEAVQAGTGHPVTDTAYWIFVSATNQRKMFDSINNTQTEYANAIIVTLTPSQIACGLYLGGVAAESVDVVVTDPIDGIVYSKTESLNMSNSGSSFWGWSFNRIRRKNFFLALDLPPYWEATVTVSINNPGGVAKCGMCAIGPLTDLGITQNGLGVEEKDYSSTRFDVDGTSETVVRGYSKILTLDVVIYNDQIDTANDQMADYRQRNVVWIGSADFGHTVVFGKRASFKSVIADWPTSRMALKIDGVI